MRLVLAAAIVFALVVVTRAVVSLRAAARNSRFMLELGDAVGVEKDTRKAEAILKQGADPNLADCSDCYDSLVIALSNKDEAMLQLLLRYHADPTQSLYRTNSKEIVEALIKLGGNPNARVGFQNETPLMYHSTVANWEVVQVLLRHGADPATPGSDGRGIIEQVEYAAAHHSERATAYAKTLSILRTALQGKHQETRDHA